MDAAEKVLGTLEKERQPSLRESGARSDQTWEKLREEKEKESLNEELHELKKENKLLKEKNALANQKKQCYEYEIKRLNKALQDALKLESSSSPEDCLGKCEMECSHKEMKTEMEVLKQQIKACQMEKEKLERQLKQMYFPTCNCGWNFHLRDPCVPTGPGAVQDLQKHPPDYRWYAPDQFPPDVQHKANAFSSEKKANQ